MKKRGRKFKYDSIEHYLALHMQPDGNPTGCILWTGPFSKKWMRAKIHVSLVKRFGLLSTNVNRTVYGLAHPDFDKDLLVCHGPCNNGMCVNIDHLHLGTTQTNAWERSAYGKVQKGHDVHTSKLTEKQVIKAKTLYKQGFTVAQVMKLMDLKDIITYSGMHKICNGKNWRDIKV